MSSKPKPDNRPLEVTLPEWLETQGYPLEMRVAAACRRAGFDAYVSEFYSDPESDKVREIDVVAAVSLSTPNIDVRVVLVIECKSSRDHPWVLFVPGADSHLDIQYQFVFAMASKLGRRLINLVRRQASTDALPLFRRTPRPAYGATQAFTSGTDVVYTAVLSVLSAARARVAASNTLTEEWPQIEIVFPVVITNARLFQNYLDEHDLPVLHETDEATLVWRRPIPGQSAALISVVAL